MLKMIQEDDRIHVCNLRTEFLDLVNSLVMGTPIVIDVQTNIIVPNTDTDVSLAPVADTVITVDINRMNRLIGSDPFCNRSGYLELRGCVRKTYDTNICSEGDYISILYCVAEFEHKVCAIMENVTREEDFYTELRVLEHALYGADENSDQSVTGQVNPDHSAEEAEAHGETAAYEETEPEETAQYEEYSYDESGDAGYVDEYGNAIIGSAEQVEDLDNAADSQYYSEDFADQRYDSEEPASSSAYEPAEDQDDGSNVYENTRTNGNDQKFKVLPMRPKEAANAATGAVEDLLARQTNGSAMSTAKDFAPTARSKNQAGTANDLLAAAQAGTARPMGNAADLINNSARGERAKKSDQSNGQGGRNSQNKPSDNGQNKQGGSARKNDHNGRPNPNRQQGR